MGSINSSQQITPPPLAGERGFTFLELALVVCVVAVLYAVSLQYSIRVLAMTERVTAEQVIISLRNGTEFQAMRHLLSNPSVELPKLEYSNPIQFLARPPENYLGELNTFEQTTLKKDGVWYFDKAQRVLVYRVRYSQYFESKRPKNEQIRLQVMLLYTDLNNNNRFDKTADQPTGLVLQAKEPYRWTIEPESLVELIE